MYGTKKSSRKRRTKREPNKKGFSEKERSFKLQWNTTLLERITGLGLLQVFKGPLQIKG